MTVSPSFIHLTVGGGEPVTSHSKMMSMDSCAYVFEGLVKKRGGTTRQKPTRRNLRRGQRVYKRKKKQQQHVLGQVQAGKVFLLSAVPMATASIMDRADVYYLCNLGRADEEREYRDAKYNCAFASFIIDA